MPSKLPSESPALDAALHRLTEGARRHALRSPADRGTLALQTAQAVAAVAIPWGEEAAAAKLLLEPASRGGPPAVPTPAAVLAEETATGPLATLRLLVLTAQTLADAQRGGLPTLSARPRLGHPDRRGDRLHGGLEGHVEVDVLPAGVGRLQDQTVFRGYRGTVRCGSPGDMAAFDRAWAQEIQTRPKAGGVAVVLGAGNVTGLAVADAISHIFEYGRAVLLKLHPVHGCLEPLFREALGPLIAAGVLEIVTGGAEVAQAAVAAPLVTHVHLTGGIRTYEALVWGGPRRDRPANARPVLAKPITCELGNVTPWIVVPGRYTRQQLECQADMVAASIVNNTSFNCIATKLVITCRSWDQRQAFLDRVQRRLAEQPPRRAWYPGSTALWETLAERQAPADGTLPIIFRTGLDPDRDARWMEREWFVPCVGEVAIEADSVDSFCSLALEQTRRIPGSLAANVTLPAAVDPAMRRRQEMLLDHLAYGVVAVNCWSALAYAMASIPWGGFPGGTLEEPGSGLGMVHDPLLLPLVHNSILRGPLVVWPKPPWFAWNTRGVPLTRGVTAMYARAAAGRATFPTLMRLLPDVLMG
jgi:acyl-CoA reductase-like NAD-dependent aldehyde dehydrogenase